MVARRGTGTGCMVARRGTGAGRREPASRSGPAAQARGATEPTTMFRGRDFPLASAGLVA